MLVESSYIQDGSPHEAIAPIETPVRIMQRNAIQAGNVPVAKIVDTMALLYEHQTTLAHKIGIDEATVGEFCPLDEDGLITLFDAKMPNVDAEGRNKGSAHVVRSVIAVTHTLQAIQGLRSMWTTDTPWHFRATHPGVITDNLELGETIQSYDPAARKIQTRMGDIVDMLIPERKLLIPTDEIPRLGIQSVEEPTNLGVALVVYSHMDIQGSTYSWLGVKPSANANGLG